MKPEVIIWNPSFLDLSGNPLPANIVDMIHENLLSDGPPYHDLPPFRLKGEAYRHPSFKDGSEVVTSMIQEIRGETIMHSCNTCYHLVFPS